MKRQRRVTYDQGLAYFVTAKVAGSVEIFANGEYAEIVLRNLDYYRAKYGFELLAYVIMPNHLHLVIRPRSKGNISEIMRDLKKHSARQIIEELKRDGRVDVLHTFAESARKYHPVENRNYQVWADRFDDVAIHSDGVLRTKIDYIHNNPVKVGLVGKAEDYLYSSAKEYASTSGPIEAGSGQGT